MLGRHILASHKICQNDYLKMFPLAIVTDPSTKERMSNSNHLTGKVIGSLSERYGEDVAAEIKQKIGDRSGKARLGKSRSHQGETLKKVWEVKRDEWSKGIKESFTAERRAVLSTAMKKVAAERTHSFKRTKFELSIAEFLDANCITFQQQFRLHSDEFGTAFYDFYLPELNLLIEADGEFWHSVEDRIHNDVRKNAMAKMRNFKLLRISDKEFKRTFSDIEKIMEYILMSMEDLDIKNDSIIQRRKLKLF